MAEPPQPTHPPPHSPLRPAKQPQSVLTPSTVKRPRARAHRCMENRPPLSSTVLAEENGSKLVVTRPFCVLQPQDDGRIDLF